MSPPGATMELSAEFVASLTNTLGRIEGTMNGMEKQVSQLQTEMASIDAKVSASFDNLRQAMDNRISALEIATTARLNNHADRLSTLEKAEITRRTAAEVASEERTRAMKVGIKLGIFAGRTIWWVLAGLAAVAYFLWRSGVIVLNLG